MLSSASTNYSILYIFLCALFSSAKQCFLHFLNPFVFLSAHSFLYFLCQMLYSAMQCFLQSLRHPLSTQCFRFHLSINNFPFQWFFVLSAVFLIKCFFMYFLCQVITLIRPVFSAFSLLAVILIKTVFSPHPYPYPYHNHHHHYPHRTRICGLFISSCPYSYL